MLPASPSEAAARVARELAAMGVIDEDDIVWSGAHTQKYANVIFTHDIYRNRATVHEYLDGLGISYAGRFGEWGYLWSDQSVKSGIRAAKDTIDRMR